MAARGSGGVLVTGGAGFIGSHATAHLPAGDVEILFADLRDALPRCGAVGTPHPTGKATATREIAGKSSTASRY